MSALLWGHVLDAKLAALDRAVKANFDPNQPRVPAGNPDGGQWTSTGGSGSSRTSNDVRVAQVRRRNRALDAGGTFAQVTRRDVTEALARTAIQNVQRLDPSWRPSPSLTRQNSIRGQIRRAEDHLREAQARLRELELQTPQEAIRTLRQGYGKDLAGGDLLGAQDTVAHTRVGGKTFMGVNSGARVDYSPQDFSEAASLRLRMIWKYPEVMSTGNSGRIPNNALYHAETTVLLRAARENGGTLAGRTIEITVDREICQSCEKVLPHVGLELGNPTVKFTEPSGRVRTMRDGSWFK